MPLDKRRSVSLPQLLLMDEDGREVAVQEDVFIDHSEYGTNASPSRVPLTPTLRAQILSPFWTRTSSFISTPRNQIPGSPGDSPLDHHGQAATLGAVGFSMLHAQAITGNTSGLEKLASGHFCDIDLVDKFGRTPLMYAILGNYPECVDILLKHGSDPSIVDYSERNSLHWSVHHDRIACVRSILSKGKIDWRTPDQGGVTVLHLASRHKQKSVLQLLIKHYKISKGEVDVMDLNKRTALHWAASNHRADPAKELIKLGSSVAVLDVEGKTPLHWAVSSSDPDTCKLARQLLNCKPDTVVNWQDYEGRIPLHLAVLHSNQEVVSILVGSHSCRINSLDNNLRSPLHLAALSGNTGMCALLLDSGAKLEIYDDIGATPVHLAVLSGSDETVELFALRRLGDTVDVRGRTPLMWAAARGMVSILAALKDGQLDLADAAGYTALHIAVSCGLSSSCSVLISAGCHVSLGTSEGLTPLMLAAQLGFPDAAHELLEYGADIEMKDGEGRTALHHASQSGQSYLLCLLIKSGSNLNALDRYGRTAFHMACYGGYLEIITVLLECGCRINLQDHEGFCPLHWAVRQGHLDVVKLLLKNSAFPNNIGVLQVENDVLQVTPTDSALMKDYTDILSTLLENGGVRVTRIYNIAATIIQAYWRGYRIRKSLSKRKELFVKHEKLKAHKKKNSTRKKLKSANTACEEDNVSGIMEDDEESVVILEQNRIDITSAPSRSRIQCVAGRFLGSMVEGHQRSSYLRRIQPGEDQPLPKRTHKKASLKRDKDSSSSLLSAAEFSYNLQL